MIKGKRKYQILISLPLILTLLVVVSFPLSAAGLEYPDTPAGKRLKEIVTLLNEGSRQKWKDYMEKNYTQKFIKIAPITRHLQVFSQICDDFGGFEYKSFDKSKSPDFKLDALMTDQEIVEELKRYLEKLTNFPAPSC
jgi:hypothetical protein